MKSIISWCNANEGFMTAILSVVGLLLSGIAIGVSIHTSRQPYKKGIKLAYNYDFQYVKNEKSETEQHLTGITVNAVNVGFRNINIVSIGLAIKDYRLLMKYKELVRWDNDVAGLGILSPTAIATMKYDLVLLAWNLNTIHNKKASLYILVLDSEGQCYHKRVGRVDCVERYLLSNRKQIIAPK